MHAACYTALALCHSIHPQRCGPALGTQQPPCPRTATAMPTEPRTHSPTPRSLTHTHTGRTLHTYMHTPLTHPRYRLLKLPAATLLSMCSWLMSISQSSTGVGEPPRGCAYKCACACRMAVCCCSVILRDGAGAGVSFGRCAAVKQVQTPCCVVGGRESRQSHQYAAAVAAAGVRPPPPPPTTPTHSPVRGPWPAG